MKSRIALHPFLFSIYTILVLFQQNKDDILPVDVVRPRLDSCGVLDRIVQYGEPVRVVDPPADLPGLVGLGDVQADRVHGASPRG